MWPGGNSEKPDIQILEKINTVILLLLATATKAQSVIRALFGRFITLHDSD